MLSSTTRRVQASISPKTGKATRRKKEEHELKASILLLDL